MITQSDLFAPPEVEAIHDEMERRNGEFLERVRRLVAGHHAGTGEAISTDEVWRIMDRYGIAVPDGCSPNVLGGLFSHWSRARAKGWTRSTRAGAHGNLLRTWIVD